MANPHNLSVHPVQGVPMPQGWQHQAAARAAAADANYLDRLQNAWRGSQNPRATVPAIQSCRINADSAAQPAARLDSELVLIGSSEEWETWRDSHGAIVRKRRKQ